MEQDAEREKVSAGLDSVDELLKPPGEPMVAASVRSGAQGDFDQAWSAVFGDGKVKSVLFTAAGRREGVSTLVAGTALTGARIDIRRRVAIVDLNLRYPQQGRLVEAREKPGLADVLAGKAALEQVAQTVGTGNMTLYVAGERLHSALPLLAGAAVRDMITQLLSWHDRVLIDCPAANLFPDAQLLAPLVDGAVLVAEAGATRRESLAEAKKRIELGRGRVLGVVLNKRRYPVPRFLYRRS
jgi:capsular exopolysaccharide synthesis family protein